MGFNKTKAGSIFVTTFARLGLGVSFLSAVADRIGLWGAYGTPHVAWGDFMHLTAYTARLNWFVPQALIPALAWIATCEAAIASAVRLVASFLRQSTTQRQPPATALVRLPVKHRGGYR